MEQVECREFAGEAACRLGMPLMLRQFSAFLKVMCAASVWASL